MDKSVDNASKINYLITFGFDLRPNQEKAFYLKIWDIQLMDNYIKQNAS